MINIYSPIEVDEEEMLRNDEQHELFYSKINALPESIQDILFDQAVDDTIKKLSGEFQLNQNQTIEIVRLVRDIAITDSYLGNIVSEVTSRLAVGQDVAGEIANRLITELFAPALEDIKKLHVEKFGGKPEEKINPNNVLDLRK